MKEKDNDDIGLEDLFQEAADNEVCGECRERIRAEAIGWMYGYACFQLDLGKDLRTQEFSKILESARSALNKCKK